MRVMTTTCKILALFAIIAICFFAGRRSANRYRQNDGKTVVFADTVTVRDTLREPFPVVVDVTISENVIEAPLADIVIKNDSLVVLPVEVKTYEGKGYRAQVSGYKPNLDWVEVYPETRYITEHLADSRRNMLYVSGELMYSDRFTTAALLMYRHQWKYLSLEAGAGYDTVSDGAVIAVRVRLPLFRW